ncbi:saccharopine dehydrogenase family protein [Myxococcus sp. RHSTA-1-4]|uniref:saccharopine dehydrogenase family protein n=1 Tax=Myxococcus sp. RHSTA-1-4 TaxID=2874601 RepID=UPI001CC13B96|nr:saccharopine dehydrogenase NADP-binding domain-containing protein [Myxococcus sp. RHSTA-1-4]MBZ4419360.1 saccharopine dehydrogenase NADP-binding domain-containing protein [Myxococcus sp. RHSTA-1-4]
MRVVQPRREGNVVIVGGYGQVGQAVARALAPTLPGRVVVAGRSQSRAESFATSLGHGARGLRFDADAEDAGPLLADTAAVVMCVDPRRTGFAERCLQAGVDYVDVTAKQESLDALERFDALARAAGGTAVLGVGVAPGLTNLLGAWAASRMEAVERLDLFLLMGAADVHGVAALEWTLDNLAVDFDVYREGRLQRVHGFRERADVRFPGEARARGAWRFNFPDQRTLARTLSLPTVSTWLGFEPPWLTSLVALAVRLGAARWLRAPRLRGALLGLAGRVHSGSDVCAVLARAEGMLPGGRRGVCEASLHGRQEAVLTGEVAAEVVRELLAGNRPGGVLHLERFTEPEKLLRRIEARSPGTRLWPPSSPR